MGTNIHLGGVAADMGASAGAGFQKGVTQGLKQNREDQLLAQEQAKESAAAQEMIEATKAIYGAELDRQDNLMPDYDPGQATIVQTGLPAALGGNIPMFLNPTPNKGQEQIDGLGAAYARNIKSFKDPKAAQVYTEAAIQSLDDAHAGFIKENLQGSISSAVQNKAVSEAQAAPFLEGIALGEDPRQVYQEWRQFASEQIESKRDAARVERMAVGMVESALAFKEQARADPENGAWLNSQAKEMEDLTVWVRETALYGHNDLDAQQVWKAYQDIKYRLNPEQSAKVADQERSQQLATAKLLGSLISDLKQANPDADTSQYEEQMRGLIGDEGLPVPPPHPAIPGVVATGQEANYDSATGVIGDAPPPQTPDKSTAQAAEVKAVKPLSDLSEKLLSNEETGRKGKISKAKDDAELEEVLKDAVIAAGVDPDGDVTAQLELLPAAARGILAAVHQQIMARKAELATKAERDQFFADQAERVKQPDKAVQAAAKKAGGGGGSPGKPIQAIP